MNSTTVTFAERADFYELEHAAKLGRLLPAASARALEKILLVNPNDIVNRARLLGHYWEYYGVKNSETEKVDSDRCIARVKHILWFIENVPDCIFSGNFYLSCDPNKGENHYQRVSEAWKDQVKACPTCVQSRVNYALFLFNHDPNLAGKLLLEVRQMEPMNEWALSLLPLLGHVIESSLPLTVVVAEEPQNKVALEERLNATTQMLSDWAQARISRATVETQEGIVAHDHFDIWARLDILRWCDRNIERANHLGFDPAVAQRWYRHALWILHNTPSINLSTLFRPDFGFGKKLPADFFVPMRDKFLDAFEQSPHKVQIIQNAIGFFLANVGLEETKRLLFPLKEWKEFDRKTRNKLTKEINWKSPKKTIFEKNINLDPFSVFVDADVSAPPTTPMPMSMWANDLDLSNAFHNGHAYAPDCAANLEHALDTFGSDLVSLARLAGAYSRHRHSLDQPQAQKVRRIMLWFIEKIPESNFAAEFRVDKQDVNIEIAPLKATWLEQIEHLPLNTLIAENAASWLSFCDPLTATQIAEKIIAKEPDNIFVLGLLHGLARGSKPRLGFRDIAFETYCENRIRNFKPIANKGLTGLCDDIDPYIYGLLDSLTIPSLTLWSNEQALKLNPNDLILRSEILGLCNRHQYRRLTFFMNDPELSRKRTEHFLWLIENVPHSNLYLFTRDNGSIGIPSHGEIVIKAVKAQRKVYGKTVAKYRAEFPRKKGKSTEY